MHKIRVKILIASIAFVVASLGWVVASAQETDPAAILKKVDDIRSPGENFVFTVQLQARTARGDNESEFDVSVRNSTKSLVLYRQPIKQRGRALLLDGANMWIYIPGTSRPVRISPQQQLIGAVSNADVARVVFSLDYQAQAVERVTLNDKPALKLTLAAHQDNSTYQRIHLWVAEKTFAPQRAEFFSLSGKLVRAIDYQGYQKVLDQMRPTVLEITDAITPSNHAILRYSNFRIKETPEEYYQPAYLGRLAN
jgi:outer membrane lipoprotein-sorting protein